MADDWKKRYPWWRTPGEFSLLGEVIDAAAGQKGYPERRPGESQAQWLQRINPPAPQGKYETNLNLGLRKMLHGLPQGLSNMIEPAWTATGRAMVEPFMYGADTPASRQTRAVQRNARDQKRAGPVIAPAAAAVEGPAPAGASPFNPFAGFRSTSKPGDARDGGRRRHAGRDWAMPPGTQIRAPLAWEVIARREEPGYGRYMDVKFSDGSEHRFAHLSAFAKADKGPAGSMIALSGASGNATGPSVHVETRLGGNRIDPATYYNAFSGQSPRSAQMEELAQNFGGPAPAFDRSGFQQASGFVDQATAALMKPVSFSAEEQPRPDRPAPTPFEAPDLSAGDRAFAAAAPTNPFDDPKVKTRLLRDNFFKGMAQGLASINWSSGPGLGELFAKVGAGALSGRLHGDDIIRSKQEQFDHQMREYSMALANRDDRKAEQLANVTNQNIAQMNSHNNNLFADKVQEWGRNLPTVENGNLVTRRIGKDNKVTTTITPISHAPVAAGLMQKAQIALSLGNAQNDYAWRVYGAAREDARTALAYTMTNPQATPQAQDQAMLFDVADRVGALVNAGRWQDLFATPAEAQALQTQAQTAAGYRPLPGVAPTKEQQETVNNFLTTKLIELHIGGGQQALKQLYTNPAVGAAYLAQQAGNRRTSVRTDNKGRTTSTTSTSYDD